MKIKELIKELVEFDPESEIRITIMAGTMPNHKDYHADIDIDGFDYVLEVDKCQMLLTSGEFINEDGESLTNLLKQCKLTGDGITEFAEYIKQ
jgi:hypothetical protein